MIVGLLSLLVLAGVLNILFYEYRVIKGLGNPKTFDFTGYQGRFDV